MDVTIDRVRPIELLIGKIGVVWLLGSNSDDGVAHLGKVSIDMLNMI